MRSFARDPSEPTDAADLEIGSRERDLRSRDTRARERVPLVWCIILAYNRGTIRRRRRCRTHAPFLFSLLSVSSFPRAVGLAISTHRNNYRGENTFSCPARPPFRRLSVPLLPSSYQRLSSLRSLARDQPSHFRENGAYQIVFVTSTPQLYRPR